MACCLAAAAVFAAVLRLLRRGRRIPSPVLPPAVWPVGPAETAVLS